MIRTTFLLLCAGAFSLATAAACATAGEPFVIEVVDSATGRGVPLVQLQATDQTRYITDSQGIIAFDEPGLMGEAVWFTVSSHGYEFPEESFGLRGVTLTPHPGVSIRLEIHRLNIAERMYRVTGRGIYRDSLKAGREAPLAQPLLNGRVMGQDSCQTALYRGRIYWFWGDTNRPGHFLGNFAMAGATSRLPSDGGLPPAVGVELDYFVDPESGFAKPMAPIDRGDAAPVWLDAVLTVEDPEGRERMLAHYQRVKGLQPVEQGMMLYDDDSDQFEVISRIPLDVQVAPGGHPFSAEVDGQRYFYFPVPYPAVRVKADWRSVRDISAYEAFTCLRDGAAFDPQDPAIDRDEQGHPKWRWRKGTAVLEPGQLRDLIDRGVIARTRCPFRLQDVDSGAPVLLHRSSVEWNAFRNRWVMIGVELQGASMVGEVWYAEADAPEGPWVHAKKVATHAMKSNNQDFYNPKQHAYFAEEDGKRIYFEGTYTHTFSGNPCPTPLYDYNQLMYRLDLSDDRLRMPTVPAQ